MQLFQRRHVFMPGVITSLLLAIVFLRPPLSTAEPQLKLQRLIEEAEQQNPEIQVARQRWEAAKALIPQVQSLPDPIIGFAYRGPDIMREGRIAFQQELASGPSPWEPDSDNLEQGLLNQRLFRNMKYGDGSDCLSLTRLAYTIILQDVEKLLELTLKNLDNPYALVTGIQLNGNGDQDFIWPGEMYEVIPRKRIDLSLIFD